MDAIERVSGGAARRIAEFASGFGAHDLDPGLLEAVGRAFIDTYGVGLAGRNEPPAVKARRYARVAAGGDAWHASLANSARCWGDGERLPVELAALVNGVAAHVLDYDDVTSPMRGHPSVALLPALVALGESLDADGAALAAAYVVGFEVICKLSRAYAVHHYAKGWHSTSSIGTIAAAVACAHLLKLDVPGIVHAIGLAVAQTAGTRANFGTDAKSFQAGQCNAAALRAALLAKEGFDAAPGALDGQFGYTALYADEASLDDELATLGHGTLELLRSGIEVKKYPLCYATHRAIDGMLDLRAEHALTLGDIETVAIFTSAGALTPLIHHRPQTGLEAKFSLEYAMVAALLDGHVTLASFTDDAVQRPAAQAALSRVTGQSSADGQVFPRWTHIDLTLRNGRRLSRRVDSLRGSAALPLSAAELKSKFDDCLAWGGAKADAGSTAGNTFARAMALDRYAVRDLLTGD
ncbi:MmgE/PrpD family protein [Cupriavidus pauculus]|uniref:MmgE/PrpD family protein n=1 Tax=Cupriavidus pauculus TaxID=82633 RepID=A0A5P2HDM2_9BURK|nr:MmgE/PrpD family protein [Cupriavidus pauculus]QET06136.1 MmgE/PrpD family protein [Cupriavidus pauculus]